MTTDSPTWTLESLAQLVADLREAQRRWFKTHEQTWIIRSRTLEKQVDQAVEGILSKQPKLW